LARSNPSRRRTFSNDPGTLRNFEDQGRIKEAVPGQKYTDPVSEKIEDVLDQAELFEILGHPEEVPDDNLDPNSACPGSYCHTNS
jgi:hypothetical protein